MSINKHAFLLTVLLDYAILMPCSAAKSLPDSLLSIKKVYVYNRVSQDTSLLILKQLRQRGMEPEWRLLLVEGDLYRNTGYYHRAIACYEKALPLREVQNDYELQAMLWRRLMNCHDFLIDELSLMDDIYHLRQCGKKCNKEGYHALADFVMGKRMHMHNMKKDAYQRSLESLETLKRADFEGKMDALRYCYVTLVKMYRSDHRFSEALKMSEEAEKLIKTPISSDETSCGTKHWLHYLYAIKASLLSEYGRSEEADSVYRLRQQLHQDNVASDVESVPYLLYSNKLDEALAVIGRYKAYLNSEGDSIEFRMLKTLLIESYAYSVKGDFEKASKIIYQVATLSTQLYRKISRLEMNARYGSLQELDRLNNRNMWLFYISVAMLVLLFMAALIIWYSRRTYEANLRMHHAVNRAMAYQKAVMRADEEAERLQEMLMKQTDEREPKALPEKEQTLAKSPSDDMDEDEMLFVLLDKQVTKRQLFLNPNLSREDLMRLIGVDKNRIGRIMGRYSDATNVSTYINQKRACYAAEYMKRHPEHTIAAVVEACGMSNAVTLNRTFKELFGESPSAYRQHFLRNNLPQ